MRLQTPGLIAWTAALALLAGCESTPVAGTPGKPAKVETRALPGAAAAAPAAATTSTGVAPQSRVATVDLGATGARAAAGSGASTTPLTNPPTLGAGAAAAGTALLAAPRERTVFFDFDSFVIKDDFKGLLDGHARALAANRGRRMMIEGHTDERGGREYNLALGQKRAEAVLRSLTLLGAPAQQLEAVSFGKERPLEQGSNEAAWSRNRRAELKDR